MHLYNFDLVFSEEIKDNDFKNKYVLYEAKKLDSKLFYKLNLNNNQDREVKILSNNSFNIISKDQIIAFVVEDILTFYWSVNRKEIYYIFHENGTDKLLKYWLYHTFFPILLTFENKYYFLHAGAVEIDFKPVLFIADSFGGKSTMTDFFMKKGHTMISDDKVATYESNNQLYSVPSYPFHRPYRRMEDLGLVVDNFATESKHINCIFNLVKSPANSDIVISEIFGIEKFKVLRYSTDINLPIHKELRFKSLSNIANKVEIFNITIPWDLNRLEDVYQSIIEFIKGR